MNPHLNPTQQLLLLQLNACFIPLQVYVYSFFWFLKAECLRTQEHCAILQFGTPHICCIKVNCKKLKMWIKEKSFAEPMKVTANLKNGNKCIQLKKYITNKVLTYHLLNKHFTIHYTVYSIIQYITVYCTHVQL